MDIKVQSQFVIDMDVEKLQHIQNAVKLAQAKSLPGQLLMVEVTPGISFRFQSDDSRKVPSRGAEARTEATI